MTEKVRTPRWRRITGITFVVLGALLAPIALVSAWAVAEVSNTDTFVATFAPLASEPQVQALVSEKVTEAIVEQVDFDAIVSPLFESLGATLGPAGSTALDGLQGIVVGGVQQLIGGAVTNAIESPAFATVWEQALRASHTVLITALQSDGRGALTVDTSGQVGIELGPIVEQVKTALVDQGMNFAARIPAVDRTIVVMQSDVLAQARTAYAIATAIAFWMPWLALALVVGGLLLAGAGIRALITSAAGVALTMVILLVGLAIGRSVVIAETVAADIPHGVAEALFDQVVGGVYSAATTILVFVLVIALVAFVFGPFDVVGRVKKLTTRTAD